MIAEGSHPLYDIPVRDIMGKEKPIGETIRGKVTLVVNVASKCGCVRPLYAPRACHCRLERRWICADARCTAFLMQNTGRRQLIAGDARTIIGSEF